jgi:hypothetical protein
MPARHIVLHVTFIMLMVEACLGQSTQPATQPAVPMDLAGVVFDWNTSNWKPKVESPPPLVVIGGMKPEQDRCRYEYIYAVNGRSFAGSRFLLGYLGGAFPEGSTILAETFERQGEQIRLVFRYSATSTAPKRNGPACFFAATLDESLADGIYHVTVELKDVPAGLIVPAIQRLTFQKPDPRIKRAQEELEQVKSLTSQELFDRYREHASTMKGISAPHEGRFLGNTPLDFADDDTRQLRMLKSEIIRRGTEISPLLLEALKEQAVRNPELPPDQSNPPAGMARELMEMLTQIGDARAAPVMVDILSGKLRCNRFVVHAAVEHIEKLTLVRFRKFDPHHTSYAEAVRGADATHEPHEPKALAAYRLKLAPKYALWLAEHPVQGADTTPWTREAIRAARAWLERDDLPEAYNAATFLRSGAHQGRVVDDDPARTMLRIAAILEQCEVASSSKTEHGYVRYSYRHKPTGQMLPVTIGNWARLLTNGPSVPPAYAALLIRLDREMGSYPGAMAHDLLKVGGTEAMAYRVEVYPRLLEEVRKTGIDPKTNISELQDRRLKPLVWNCQLYRWAIERWAGRTFATDAELDAWWAAENGKSNQHWLETGLPITATRADAGDAQSQYLLRLMLGKSLPHPPNHHVWMEPGQRSDPPPRAEAREPFRVQWLADHADRLHCDVEKGTFVLNPPAK